MHHTHVSIVISVIQADLSFSIFMCSVSRHLSYRVCTHRSAYTNQNVPSMSQDNRLVMSAKVMLPGHFRCSALAIGSRATSVHQCTGQKYKLAVCAIRLHEHFFQVLSISRLNIFKYKAYSDLLEVKYKAYSD